MKASVSISSDIHEDFMFGDEELTNHTQCNVDNNQVSDFCKFDSESSSNMIKFSTVARESYAATVAQSDCSTKVAIAVLKFRKTF